MTLKLLETAIVDGSGGNDAINLSSLVTLTGTGNPTYLVVNALDRNEYTATSTGATGFFSGDGASLGLKSIGGDGRGAGIVFAWQASSGQYVNATYGSLSQLVYTDSGSPNDVTNLSFFGTGSASLAQSDAGNAYALMQQDATGYIGSATIATNGDFSSPPPSQATPDGVAAAAMAMVGRAWNQNGCWVLASTVAAEAGASLPVQSTAVGEAGAANGEWIVLYDGPVSSSATWSNLVSTGDIVSFATSATTGHITTCVSGSGSSAMLVDNITYVGPGGGIQNGAHDGSASDVLISAPHAASQEFAGVSAKSVVIYALDTPAVADKSATETLSTGATVSLASLFTATDPAHKAIASYQIYDDGGSDSLFVNGQAVAASANDPLTVSSLTAVSLSAGGSATTDTLEIRASNGTYWGDWQSLPVDILAPAPKPPVLSKSIAAQTWLQGSNVNFSFSAGLFKDPQGSALTYSAAGAAGASLPNWLSFNASTDTFSGTVPAGMEKIPIVVTATDALGASASTSFTVTVPAASPVLSVPEAAQTLAENGAFSFALPSSGFTDPQGESLTYKATLSTGGALPSWLKFSAATQTFSGTAPAKAQSLELKVTATDTSALSASETFAVNVSAGSSAAFTLQDWTTLAQEAPSLITKFGHDLAALQASPYWPIAEDILMQVFHIS